MLIYENGAFSQTVLEKQKVYNVTKGTWHYLAVSEDALLIAVENSDTDASNTDILCLENEYFI